MSRAVSRRDATVHAVAVLAGAVLVFQIQPIVGKLLLPTYGGGASVWTTCMFFFQAMLLAGYGYTHVLTNALPPRRQVLVHGSLLGLSALFLPVSIGAEGLETTAAHPAGAILLVLLATIGMPFVMLASTAPLIQRWSTLAGPSRPPWRLYALSNAGALAALLTYPLLIEPNMALRAQTLIWSAGYVAFLAASLAACRMLWIRHAAAARAEGDDVPAGTARRQRLTGTPAALAVALAASGVALLLAVTNQITQNIAPVPFLWVLPLVVYLLTWIVCFCGERWYDRAIWGALLIVAGSTLIILDFFGTAFPVVPAVTAWLLVLFCLCMVCHGELYRLRPAPRQLSLYYLLIASGGAAGGALVSLLAPAVFVRYWEALAAVYVLYLTFGVLVLREGRGKGGGEVPRASALQAAVDRWSRRLFAGGWVTGVLVFPAIVAMLDALRPEYDVASSRNFYGMLNVRDIIDEEPRRVLIDGTTIHGFQLLDDSREMLPTSYYGRQTGIGFVMERMGRSGASLHVGVVGLGTGTLAAWGRPGDVFRFYELNPAVVELAQAHFSFLRNSAATVDIVVGDGRISLERELERIGSREYDVLVLDAFSSGAIPVHLLTREALQMYLAHVKRGGVLAFHVTNSYLDLSPVIANLASLFDRRALLVTTVVDTGVSSRSDWVLLVEGEWIPVPEVPRNVVSGPLPPPSAKRIWTDDYSDLLSTLKP